MNGEFNEDSWCSTCQHHPENCNKCEVCDRCMPTHNEDGICVDCSIAWLASHQIGDREVVGPNMEAVIEIQ